jgi:drug/metabolite transporter (DMT)-like permease
MTSWQVASFRSGLAAIVMLLLVPAARRGWDRRTAAVGLAYAATLVLYVLANKLTTAANTIFLQGAAPLYILLLAPWLLAEPIRRRDLVLMGALAAGMVLFFVGHQSPSVTAPDPVTGNLLGLLTGFFWALTILGLRWLGKGCTRNSGASAGAVVCGNLIAFAVALPWALPVAAGTTLDWSLIAYLGVFQVGLAYVCLTRGVKGVGALEASLLLLVEPVLNPVWAWLVHGEQPASWALLGGATILAATTLKTWFDREEPR